MITGACGPGDGGGGGGSVAGTGSFSLGELIRLPSPSAGAAREQVVRRESASCELCLPIVPGLAGSLTVVVLADVHKQGRIKAKRI